MTEYQNPKEYISSVLGNPNAFSTVPIKDATFTDISVLIGDVFSNRGIEFSNCIFKQEVHIHNISTATNYQHHFTFKECAFENGIKFFRCDLNVVDIIQCTLKKGYLGLESSSISSFKASLKEAEKVYIHGGGKYNRLGIGSWGPNKVKHLIIECDGLEGDIYVDNSEVEDLEIIRLFPKGSINISDSKIQSFLFTYFKNLGKITIRHVAPIRYEGSYFTVYKSTLGDVQFFDIDFRKYLEFNVLSSDISEIKFVKTVWHENINSLPGKYTPEFSDRDKIQENQTRIERKEVYKQLRHASNKQGDVLNEGYFHEKEMNTYYHTINWCQNFWTKFILGSSRIFGNYGKNFRQPLIALLLLHSITLAIMVHYCYDNFMFVPAKEGSWSDFGDFMGEYVRLLNPVHSFDKAKGLWIIPDTIIRIYTSFFIYNMLRATRRFVK